MRRRFTFYSAFLDIKKSISKNRIPDIKKWFLDINKIHVLIWRNVFWGAVYYKLSISWYQEFYFFISRIHFLISRNKIIAIKKWNLFLISRNPILDIKKSISWYQEFDFLLDIKKYILSRRFTTLLVFLNIKNLISWNQEMEFLISRIWFLDIK